MHRQTLALPYTTNSQERKKPFSEDMELAAIMCFAETARRKSSSEKQIEFISKQFYPIWAIPWDDKCILVDGARQADGAIPSVQMFDIEAFIESLRRRARVREQYSSELKRQYGTIVELGKVEKSIVRGLISDAELLSDLSSLMKDVRSNSTHEPASTLIFPLPVSEKDAEEVSNQLVDRYNKLSSEIKALTSAKDTVARETSVNVSELRKELQETREDFSRQIASLRETTNEKGRKLEIELKFRIDELAKAAIEKSKPMLAERNQLEKQMVGLEQNKNEYEKRRDLRRLKNDRVGEARWKVKLQYARKQMLATKSRITMIGKTINKTEKETEKNSKQLREDFQKIIAQDAKRIRNLENLQNETIKDLDEETQDIQQSAQVVNNALEVLIDNVKSATLSMDQISLTWKIEAPALIGVPYYALCLAGKNGRSYHFYPPMLVQTNEGLISKIRTAMSRFSLESRLASLLRPRSREIAKLLESLEKGLRKDKQVEKSSVELGASNNLFAQSKYMEKLKNGLGELEKEGWIKPDEKNEFLHGLVAH